MGSGDAWLKCPMMVPQLLCGAGLQLLCRQPGHQGQQQQLDQGVLQAFNMDSTGVLQLSELFRVQMLLVGFRMLSCLA